MIFSAASAAVADVLSPEARGVLLKSLAVTLLLLVASWFGLKELFDWFALPWIDRGVSVLPEWAGFLQPVAAVIGGILIALGLALLLAPTTALVAGLFLDDMAEVIERRAYPSDRPGRALPALASLVLSAKFMGVVILANLLALLLLLVPGINLVAFLLVNGYLLGREFFEFAAMRFHPTAEVKALRRRHAGSILLAGLLIAAWLAVPLLNLTTPIFAAALMVHLHKTLSRPGHRA